MRLWGNQRVFRYIVEMSRTFSLVRRLLRSEGSSELGVKGAAAGRGLEALVGAGDTLIRVLTAGDTRLL